jgi:hypothetical protein
MDNNDEIRISFTTGERLVKNEKGEWYNPNENNYNVEFDRAVQVIPDNKNIRWFKNSMLSSGKKYRDFEDFENMLENLIRADEGHRRINCIRHNQILGLFTCINHAVDKINKRLINEFQLINSPKITIFASLPDELIRETEKYMYRGDKSELILVKKISKIYDWCNSDLGKFIKMFDKVSIRLRLKMYKEYVNPRKGDKKTNQEKMFKLLEWFRAEDIVPNYNYGDGGHSNTMFTIKDIYKDVLITNLGICQELAINKRYEFGSAIMVLGKKGKKTKK